RGTRPVSEGWEGEKAGTSSARPCISAVRGASQRSCRPCDPPAAGPGRAVGDPDEAGHQDTQAPLSLTFAAWRDFGSGSWFCENAETGSLTGLGCGATTFREVCEHIFPISSATQPYARPELCERSIRPETRKSGRIMPQPPP